MLQILNKTPFEAGLALFTDQHGVEKVSVSVKATFRMRHQKSAACLVGSQKPVLYADEYFETPGQSSIKYPADIVMGKLNTDIGAVGHAHSPGGKPAKRVLSSLTVGELHQRMLVYGDRHWIKRGLLGDFAISDPAPFVKMPLRYERAFGGADQTHKSPKKHAWEKRNPIGTGFRSREAGVENHPLPNLESPDQMIKSWQSRPPVAGFGFIDGGWQQRLQFGGTYDEQWQKEQFPLPPMDFDLRFFNCAHPDLVADGFLQGGEPVRLVNLSVSGEIQFELPKLGIGLMFRLGEVRKEVTADLWTLVFEPDDEIFYMVWGGVCEVGKQPSKMLYARIEMNGDLVTD